MNDLKEGWLINNSVPAGGIFLQNISLDRLHDAYIRWRRCHPPYLAPHLLVFLFLTEYDSVRVGEVGDVDFRDRFVLRRRVPFCEEPNHPPFVVVWTPTNQFAPCR